MITTYIHTQCIQCLSTHLPTAKLQHVGRAGVPGSTRYAAHEHGLTTEDMTQHVIANYAVLDEYRKGQDGESIDVSECTKNSKFII